MKREKWIDVLRGIAILAVIADHIFTLFGTFRIDSIWKHTYFSVSWFIFLSGVTNGISASKTTWVFPKSYVTFWRKRLTIIFPYIFASTVSFLVFTYPHFHIDGKRYIYEIVHFSNQPIFYYINLLLQLYIIFPFLYVLMNKSKKDWQMVLLVFGTIFLSFILQAYTTPPWPFDAGLRVMGGILLAVFFLGVLYGREVFRIDRYIFIISILIFTAIEVLLVYTHESIFKSLEHTFYLEAWSISLLFIIKFLFDRVRYDNLFSRLLNFLGRHSLFIYLFHFLMIALYTNASWFTFRHYYDFVPAIIVIIFVSVGMEYIYKKCYDAINLCLRKIHR